MSSVGQRACLFRAAGHRIAARGSGAVSGLPVLRQGEICEHCRLARTYQASNVLAITRQAIFRPN